MEASQSVNSKPVLPSDGGIKLEAKADIANKVKEEQATPDISIGR